MKEQGRRADVLELASNVDPRREVDHRLHVLGRTELLEILIMPVDEPLLGRRVIERDEHFAEQAPAKRRLPAVHLQKGLAPSHLFRIRADAPPPPAAKALTTTSLRTRSG